MSEYPKQLIDMFQTQLNEKLQIFHKKNQFLLLLPEIEECIKNTLDDFLEGKTSKTDIQDIYTLQKKNLKQKKSRWEKRIKDTYIKYTLPNSKNPFWFLIEQQNLLTEEQWDILYHNLSVDEIIQSFFKDITQWKEDNNKLLIEFPLFNTLNKTSKINAFFQDLFINLIGILKENTNGSIDSFFKTTPAFMTEAPIFAPKGFDIILQSSLGDGGVFEHLFSDEDADYEMTVSSKSSSDLKMLDAMDISLLNCIFTHIDSDFYHSRKVSLTVGELARAISKNKPSKNHYKNAKQRLKNMLDLNYSYKDSTREAHFNIFDGVLFEKPEIGDIISSTENVEITFGTLLYEAIVQKKMVYVTTNNYEALEDNLSKILYYTLQKERIRLSSLYNQLNDDTIIEEYEYTFFAKAVMFKTKHKRKNITAIKKSLMEFVEKQITIQDFSVAGDKFKIQYIPLSESEKADFWD